MRFVLTVCYFGLLFPARMAVKLLGRDPLQLRRPRAKSSYWAAKAAGGDLESYFSEHGDSTLAPAKGVAHLLLPVFMFLAQRSSRVRRSLPYLGKSDLVHGQEIPDEIYTLW